MKTRILALVSFLVVGALRNAHASDTIVIESYVGERPDDAGAVLAPVYAELIRRGYDRGRSLALAVQKQVSADGGALTTTDVMDAQHQLDTAYQHYIDGDYAAAVAGTRKVLDAYAAAPAHLARVPELRDLRFKALIIGARALEIGGKGEDAFTLMAEAVRAYPDRVPSGSEYDPSAIALYRRVRAELERRGTGTLDVTVDDGAAVIYVDERFVGTGTAHVEKLFFGRHRVYAAKGNAPGRVHEIDVSSPGVSTVNVAWGVDSVLRTGVDYVGLSMPAAAGPEAELTAAVQLGRTLGAKHVVLLSLRVLSGRRAIAGYSIAVDSENKAFAALQIEPVLPSGDALAKLAAFLAGDKNVSMAGLITDDPSTASAADVAESGGIGSRRVAALAVGGAGVLLAVGAIAADVSAHSTYDQSKTASSQSQQDSLYGSANNRYALAQGLAVGSAACLVVGAVLWLTGAERAAEQHGVSLQPIPMASGGSLVLSGSF